MIINKIQNYNNYPRSSSSKQRHMATPGFRIKSQNNHAQQYNIHDAKQTIGNTNNNIRNTGFKVPGGLKNNNLVNGKMGTISNTHHFRSQLGERKNSNTAGNSNPNSQNQHNMTQMIFSTNTLNQQQNGNITGVNNEANTIFKNNMKKYSHTQNTQSSPRSSGNQGNINNVFVPYNQRKQSPPVVQQNKIEPYSNMKFQNIKGKISYQNRSRIMSQKGNRKVQDYMKNSKGVRYINSPEQNNQSNATNNSQTYVNVSNLNSTYNHLRNSKLGQNQTSQRQYQYNINKNPNSQQSFNNITKETNMSNQSINQNNQQDMKSSGINQNYTKNGVNNYQTNNTQTYNTINNITINNTIIEASPNSRNQTKNSDFGSSNKKGYLNNFVTYTNNNTLTSLNQQQWEATINETNDNNGQTLNYNNNQGNSDKTQHDQKFKKELTKIISKIDNHNKSDQNNSPPQIRSKSPFLQTINPNIVNSQLQLDPSNVLKQSNQNHTLVALQNQNKQAMNATFCNYKVSNNLPNRQQSNNNTRQQRDEKHLQPIKVSQNNAIKIYNQQNAQKILTETDENKQPKKPEEPKKDDKKTEEDKKKSVFPKQSYLQLMDQVRQLTNMDTFQDSKYPQIIDLYEVGPQIGKGSYAVVVYGQEKRKKAPVAIKRYHKQKLLDPGKMRNVRREVTILSRVDHPNIMKLYTVIDSDEHLNLIMEYIGGTSLYAYLKFKPHRRLPEEKARNIIAQVIQGIYYLHKKRIVHRDIKLENVLIDEKRKVKLIDFGFSVRTAEGQKLSSFCGTPSYMSPEIVSKQEYTGFPSDIWTIGILLFVLFCGCFPFKGSDEKDLFNKIKQGKFVIPEYVPIGARLLLQKILKVNTEDRPTAEEILKDQWVQQAFVQPEKK